MPINIYVYNINIYIFIYLFIGAIEVTANTLMQF